MERLQEINALVTKWFLLSISILLLLLLVLWIIRKLDKRTDKDRARAAQKKLDEFKVSPFIRGFIAFFVGLTVFMALETTMRVLVSLILLPVNLGSIYVVYAIVAVIWVYSGYVAFLAGRYMYRNFMVPDNNTEPASSTDSLN